jgi:hypothetical protein
MLSSTSAVFGSMAVATAAMLLLSGERWHSDVASRPVVPGAGGTARVLVVVQEGDCPDDLRSVEGFVEDVRRRGLEVEMVPMESPAPGIPGVARAGGAPSYRPIHRAILRSGIGSTPAALLLDGDGVVRYVQPLTGWGANMDPDRVVAALDALARVLSRENQASSDPGGD